MREAGVLGWVAGSGTFGMEDRRAGRNAGAGFHVPGKGFLAQRYGNTAKRFTLLNSAYLKNLRVKGFAVSLPLYRKAQK